jgi:lysylphosphatidylglycerol synthetase-like protein (DUF2156 family)
MDKTPAEKSGIRIAVLATVIAAFFTVATFLVALLAYLRPTDAAHPPHFDFLSRTLSFPMWVGGVLIFGIIASGAWLFRFGVKRGQKAQRVAAKALNLTPSKLAPPSSKAATTSTRLPEPQ